MGAPVLILMWLPCERRTRELRALHPDLLKNAYQRKAYCLRLSK